MTQSERRRRHRRRRHLHRPDPDRRADGGRSASPRCRPPSTTRRSASSPRSARPASTAPTSTSSCTARRRPPTPCWSASWPDRLITTRGFRDVLELGRRTRPQPYGMTGTLRAADPARAAPRGRRAHGGRRARCCTPLDEAAVRARRSRSCSRPAAKALVIHFLHSYANPAHERRAAEIARALWPNGYVTLGPRAAVGVPRVRARHDGRGQRLGAADPRPLRRAPAQRAASAGLSTATSWS